MNWGLCYCFAVTMIQYKHTRNRQAQYIIYDCHMYAVQRNFFMVTIGSAVQKLSLRPKTLDCNKVKMVMCNHKTDSS